MKIKATYLFLCFLLNFYSQQYNLLPDSCFYSFIERTDNFGENNYMTIKGINPHLDTIVNGNTYIKLINNEDNEPFAVRQVNNKVYGLVKDSINELLLIDLDVPIGDTMYNLYAQGYYYHAYVYHVDSSWFNPDLHYKYFYIQAFKILVGNNWINFDWQSMYTEKFFGNHLFFFNLPPPYHAPYNIVDTELCSTDPLFYYYEYNNYGSCVACEAKINYASLADNKMLNFKMYPNPVYQDLQLEFVSEFEKTIKIFDLQGKELLKQEVSSKETRIDLAHLQAGFYFVELIQGKEKIVKSFVKE